jgi:acetyltransferase-like isoleucine patch superfamily enzyme
MKKLSLIASMLLVFFPWRIKRFILVHIFGNKIHKSAYIGVSLVSVKHIILEKDARIGHFTVIKGLEHVEVGESGRIGNLNWITGFPMGLDSAHFSDATARYPSLFVGKHAAITNRHIIDCTDRVSVGGYSTFAGFRSQILTHSIDIHLNRQISMPVQIGAYCFVGTGVILLPGSDIPKFSVIGAGSVVIGPLINEKCLYSGVPAKKIHDIASDTAYFLRKSGYVV